MPQHRPFLVLQLSCQRHVFTFSPADPWGVQMLRPTSGATGILYYIPLDHVLTTAVLLGRTAADDGQLPAAYFFVQPIDSSNAYDMRTVGTTACTSLDCIRAAAVTFCRDDGQLLGYISIQSFGSSTALDTRAALTALETRGVAGYIIDLRNNGGGLVSAGMLGPLLQTLLAPLAEPDLSREPSCMAASHPPSAPSTRVLFNMLIGSFTVGVAQAGRASQHCVPLTEIHV